MDKAYIAMSGGVDSSVAALLMLRAGYDCEGVMLRLWSGEENGEAQGRTCCSLSDSEDARAVAYKLGIPFHMFNFTDSFSAQVVDRFVADYRRGFTPNPCIECNRYMKFGRLFARADELGVKFLATGHYARTGFDEKTGRYYLRKGVDESKDQSYVLYMLTQAQLARTVFPLGNLHKDEVRRIAGENGFCNFRKRDSQDIRFVPDGDYAAFIERRTGLTFPEGDFIDPSGRVLGRHRGVIRYTVGQRRGIGISMNEPVYVSAVDPQANTVTLSGEGGLYSRALTARDVNLISVPSLEKPMRVSAKIRYSHHSALAEAVMTEGGRLSVVFDEPQRAVTRGQSVVLYDGDDVVGGGRIDGVET